MRSKLIYIAAFLSPVLVCAQGRQPFHGRVVSGSIPAEGQLVINLSSQREIRADSLGDFSFMAKPGDTIRAAVSKPENIVLKEVDFKQNPFIIEIPAYELSEVVITRYNTINAVALRIVPKGKAAHTVAERRYKETASIKPFFDPEMTGGFVPLDPLYNLINGKSKAMRRALAIEKKEMAIDKLNGLFNEDEITELFKIPKEYVQGFLFFVAEDPTFATSISSKNLAMAHFLMSGMAVKYLELIKNNE